VSFALKEEITLNALAQMEDNIKMDLKEQR
jgi:hypothetical protein